MLSKVKSYALDGLIGYEAIIETDINAGIPAVEIVGLPGPAIKESKERVRSAVKNSGFEYPIKKIIVNLAPADIKKDFPNFDLPLAIGLLVASEQISGNAYKEYIMLGELSLDGEVKNVNGIMPMLLSALMDGHKKFIIPAGNLKEASFIEGLEVYGVANLFDAVMFLSGMKVIEPVKYCTYVSVQAVSKYGVDFSDVKGQLRAKRAIEVAVAGGHNILMIGPPGAGKTMIAKCVPTVMPSMTFEEAIEVTKIHSVAGVLNRDDGIVTIRPFRCPHHTTTNIALIGGGRTAKPGEISLAHHGVLFLDELPEYKRHALETLRQPLEDRVVTIARAMRTVEYPSSFIMVASMNPCPCGNFGSRTQKCSCTPQAIHKYLNKLSGPLMDRIDIHVEVDGVSFEEMYEEGKGEPSETIKKRIERVKEVQHRRYGNTVHNNASMTNKEMEKYCRMTSDVQTLLQGAFKKLNLTARATTRVLKVARTIADIENALEITAEHVAEAIQYRSLDRKYRLV
jgi:magnesium chelatase family protein